MTERILVLGANGQIGRELVEELRKIYGDDGVIASDVRDADADFKSKGPFEKLDVLDGVSVSGVIGANKITQVYHLAAMLSATAEQKIKFAWKLNKDGLINLHDIAKEKKIKLFCPSSIAEFGPSSPKKNTPQHTVAEPTTVYGISKLARALVRILFSEIRR